jgi:uncharacterized protein (TIGR02453 family)
MATYDFHSTLSFLNELEKNNNKVWFDSNRPTYEGARDTFLAFVDNLIDELRDSDHLGYLSAKECVMRINRDIRFSKDKSPYNSRLAASIAPGGRKSTHMGYYIAIESGDRSLIAGGLYAPTPQQLSLFRQTVAQNSSELKEIISARAFVEQFGKIGGEKLKTAPQGYDRDHPEIELLQFKQVIALHRFSDNDVLAPDFLEQAVVACHALKPFLDYMNLFQA